MSAAWVSLTSCLSLGLLRCAEIVISYYTCFTLLYILLYYVVYLLLISDSLGDTYLAQKKNFKI